jgi:hypothetical protein
MLFKLWFSTRVDFRVRDVNGALYCFVESNKSGSGSPTRLIKNRGAALGKKWRGTSNKS